MLGRVAVGRSVAASTEGRFLARRSFRALATPRALAALAVAGRGAAQTGSLRAEAAVSARRATVAPNSIAAAFALRPLSSAATDVVQVKTPDFGAESITEGALQEWNKKVGDYVAAGEVLAVIETDKVSVEVKSPESGIVTELLAKPEDTVQVGQPLATIKPGGTPPPKAEAAAPAKAPDAPAAKPAKAAAKPAATAKPAASAAPAAAAPSAASGGPARAERRVKMTRMRKAIGRSMKEAQNTACMLTTFQEVDMSQIMKLRKEYKDEFEAMHGVRLGFMGAFVKASSAALKQLPSVNAVIDGETNEIVYRDYCDVSVAVASPKGLVVPVIRDAQSLSINQIEGEIGNLALRARNDELAMEDMMGGTFTITNGGVFGSLLSTPILNSGFGPQSAILGMHFTKQRPVVLKSGEIAPRPVMYLALTYDHRLVDGREAVTFLCMVRDQIEDPRRLLLEL